MAWLAMRLGFVSTMARRYPRSEVTWLASRHNMPCRPACTANFQSLALVTLALREVPVMVAHGSFCPRVG